MIRTLIVDDEELARRRCRRLLDGVPDIEVVGGAASGGEAVLEIESKKPDLVLLDVQMPDLDGFDVLRMVDSPTLPLVVFVTAHDEYALDAFEVAALDYLLKPVHRQRLEAALGRVRERLQSQKLLSRRLQRFLRFTAQPERDYLRRLPARRSDQILVFPVAEVAALRIDRGLVYATTAQGEYWTKYTSLAELERRLDPELFVRIHRQRIVNLDHVREVTALDNATARLKLSTGDLVSVSRSNLPRLRQLIDW